MLKVCGPIPGQAVPLTAEKTARALQFLPTSYCDFFHMLVQGFLRFEPYTVFSAYVWTVAIECPDGLIRFVAQVFNSKIKNYIRVAG